MKIGKTGYAILKFCHILLASIWIGAGVCLVFLIMFGFVPEAVNGVLAAIRIIDLFIIIPAVIGLLITGVLFSTLTNWGFIKHRWIIIKYVINLLPVIFGGVVMAPPLLGMIKIANQFGQESLVHPDFVHYKIMFMVPLLLLLILALMALMLSVFKPDLRFKPKSK